MQKFVMKNNVMLLFAISFFTFVNTSTAFARRMKTNHSVYNYQRDAAKIESVLDKSNNAVLITNGLDARDLKRILELQAGESYRYIDLQELIDEFSFGEAANIIEQMINFSKEPLLINKVYLF